MRRRARASAGIVCPYHAWSYRLDGSLLAAPSFRDVEGFDPDEFGLIELPSVDWHGWVFVDSPRRGRLHRARRRARGHRRAVRAEPTCASLATHEYEIAANWKIVVENYQECYHCSMIHPELCSVSPPESGANLDLPGDWVGGWMSLRDEAETRCRSTARARGVVIDGLTPPSSAP